MRTPEQNRVKYEKAMRRLHGDTWQPRRGKWVILTSDELEAKLKRRRQVNRDKKKRWLAKRPDIRKARKAAYNAKKRAKSLTGNFTRADVRNLLHEQGGLCKHCSLEIRDTYTIDHIRPLCAGGTNVKANIQLLCRPCNSKKGGSVNAL